MGSGKTTVGRQLAKELGLSFLDLDDYIEKREEAIISTIFSEKGEIYFRKKESAYLKEILLKEDGFVLSIGGGTPCYANNMSVISEATNKVVYLKLTIDSLVARLKKEKSERPLIKNIPDKELTEFIGKHLFERSFYYSQATFSFNCDDKKLNEIVDGIKKTVS
jgi:shikimate kinase